MCKSIESRKKATDNFFLKLRGMAYSKTKALYEIDDAGRADLIGFSAFVEGSLNFFKVMSDLSVRCDGLIDLPAMGERGIAAYYDCDYAVAI